MPDNPIAAAVAPGYAFTGPALELGGLMLDATDLSDVRIKIPLGMLNRHGLVAGATGTGKTKTLQLLAEQLSANGVPIFAADIKGDLSGMGVPGTEDDKIRARATSVGQAWEAKGFPVTYYALGGQGTGIPVRVTMTAFGPILLSKVLGLQRGASSSAIDPSAGGGYRYPVLRMPACVEAQPGVTGHPRGDGSEAGAKRGDDDDRDCERADRHHRSAPDPAVAAPGPPRHRRHGRSRDRLPALDRASPRARGSTSFAGGTSLAAPGTRGSSARCGLARARPVTSDR